METHLNFKLGNLHLFQLWKGSRSEKWVGIFYLFQRLLPKINCHPITFNFGSYKVRVLIWIVKLNLNFKSGNFPLLCPSEISRFHQYLFSPNHFQINCKFCPEFQQFHYNFKSPFWYLSGENDANVVIEIFRLYKHFYRILFISWLRWNLMDSKFNVSSWLKNFFLNIRSGN